MSDQDYKNRKNFYKTLKLQNLGELNKIYNFQDTIIVCEMFEQCCGLLQETFTYNPHNCNSASSFSGCVQRDKSKCCIVLPTKAHHVWLFGKTLIRGFSCVNTRLAFETEILIADKTNEKVFFDLIIDGKKQTMDENKKYGLATTKPLPYDCVKNSPPK